MEKSRYARGDCRNAGTGSRPMKNEWATNLRTQRLEAGGAFFFKQLGGTSKEYPNGARRNLAIEPVMGFRHHVLMRSVVELVGEEWAEWYRLAPAQRWRETEKLWRAYLVLGGSLDPEPDSQSPFYDPDAPRSGAAHGRPGVRVIRRSRV